MHPFKLALAASTAMIASTSLSFAAVIAQTESYSALTDWGTTPQNPSFSPTHPIGFTGFDSSLGTLTSVTITITDSINGSVNLKNNGATSTNVYAYLSNTLKYVYPTISTSTHKSSTTSYSVILGPHSTSGKHALSQTTTLAPHKVTTNLADFETGWTLTAGALGQQTSSSGDGNGTSVYTDHGGIKIVADYTYTPDPPPPVGAPEPGTLSVLGAGLAGLGLLRRRRK